MSKPLSTSKKPVSNIHLNFAAKLSGLQSVSALRRQLAEQAEELAILQKAKPYFAKRLK